jgi:predicted methyltransferase
MRFLPCLIAGLALLAQSSSAQDASRERWQKVDEIVASMGIHAGAIVADVGAADGFLTRPLAKAVGPNGRVFAVDIDDAALNRLRKRLEEDRIQNVTVIKGAVDDPRLPERALDAAVIVNSYHEMPKHQSMLMAIRRALKPDGRLVIVEPVRPSRRGRPRAEQERNHEIDSEFVLQDARAAGFRIVGLQDPFLVRSDEHIEWLMVLQPFDMSAATAAAKSEQPASGVSDPTLRVSLDEFRKMASSGSVTIVDVRDRGSFDAGHIPGAVSIPLESVDGAVEQLRKLGKPVVTYCS